MLPHREKGRGSVKRLIIGAIIALTLSVALVAGANAATTVKYHATFVEVGGAIPGGSCGSATISGIGHVAHQCVAFDACGTNCEVRTITFDDGSTLTIHESIVGVISPGNSSAARARSQARPAVARAV